jgi:ABC-type phosphate transport system substrate-binding protein
MAKKFLQNNPFLQIPVTGVGENAGAAEVLANRSPNRGSGTKPVAKDALIL